MNIVAPALNNTILRTVLMGHEPKTAETCEIYGWFDKTPGKGGVLREEWVLHPKK